MKCNLNQTSWSDMAREGNKPSIQRVVTAYFSPTGSSQRIGEMVGRKLSEIWGAKYMTFDFTRPAMRDGTICLGKQDFFIMSVPTYAGRIPNKILPYIKTGFEGDEAKACAIVTFGNRNCDSSLGELKAALENSGFCVVSAAAFVAEHAFTEALATGRPDLQDIAEINDFAIGTAGVIDRASKLDIGSRSQINAYYIPKRMDHSPAQFLRAKPITNESKCNGCGICSEKCPMGSIDSRTPGIIKGVCIKCQACIKSCPESAKYFEDPDFLSHVAMLETNFVSRAQNEMYL